MLERFSDLAADEPLFALAIVSVAIELFSLLFLTIFCLIGITSLATTFLKMVIFSGIATILLLLLKAFLLYSENNSKIF